jgi:hypothetical protein
MYNQFLIGSKGKKFVIQRPLPEYTKEEMIHLAAMIIVIVTAGDLQPISNEIDKILNSILKDVKDSRGG